MARKFWQALVTGYAARVLAGWLAGWLPAQPGLLAGLLNGCPAGWLAGWPADTLAVGWLAGWPKVVPEITVDTVRGGRKGDPQH